LLLLRSLDGEIQPDLSQSQAPRKFSLDQGKIGLEIILVQSPRMKTQGRKHKTGIPARQIQNFFIRSQVCTNPYNRPDPSFFGPGQGSLDVFDFIQMSMRIDEFQGKSPRNFRRKI
jgi:hypothetical protein